MNFAIVKSVAAKLSLATFAAGALLVAGAAPARAQQWGVDVQYGEPAYVVDRDDYYRDRARHEFFERERERREFFERQRREEFLRHEAWERRERWERFHDRDDYRGYGYGGNGYGYR